MYLELKNNILDQGTFLINHERTRENDVEAGKVSCLDMAFTNKPQKITSHTTVYPTFSDHALIIVNRVSNRMEDKKQYRKARSYKNFNRTKLSQDILEHHLYLPNLYE